MRTKKVQGLAVTVNKGDTYVPETPENCTSGRQVSIFAAQKQWQDDGVCVIDREHGHDRHSLFLQLR